MYLRTKVLDSMHNMGVGVEHEAKMGMRGLEECFKASTPLLGRVRRYLGRQLA